MSHLLRVSLPDVPGSLGAVASALGSVGVNIEAIEIVEHGSDGRAVDDFFISLLPGVMPDAAVSAVTSLEGVHVMWVSRYPTAGNLHLDLEAVELIAERPGRALDILSDMLPRVFRGDWGMVAVREGDEVRALSATPAAPQPLPECRAWFPLEKAGVLAAPAAWSSTSLGAAPLGTPERIVLFGRHGGPEILSSELARLSLLAALTVSLTQA
jgi:hypothetical protein